MAISMTYDTYPIVKFMDRRIQVHSTSLAGSKEIEAQVYLLVGTRSGSKSSPPF